MLRARRVRGRVRRHPFFTGRQLQTLAAVDVRGYIEHRREAGAGNAMINRELGLLSSALNYAKRAWEWECPNPITGR